MRELLERLIFLQAFSNGLVEEMRQQLARFYALIEFDLRRADPTGVQNRYRAGRLEVFEANLIARTREMRTSYVRRLKDRLAPLGRQQGELTRTVLVSTLGTVEEAPTVEVGVTEARMRAILNTEPFQGRVLKGHANRLGANLLDRVMVQLRLGMAREEGIDDLVRRIRGRQVAGSRAFTGGVLQTTTRESEAIVRTAVTHTANSGGLETFRANADVLDGVLYAAVLDDRTTDICLALDGTVWDLDDPDLVVPGRDTHYGCRSLLTPILAWKRLGLPEPPEPERVVRDLSTVSDEDLERRISVRRRSGGFGKVTRISSGQTATEWFRRQRASVQDHMIGRGKAEAFRRGEITSLRQLIDRDLHPRTLDELLKN